MADDGGGDHGNQADPHLRRPVLRAKDSGMPPMRRADRRSPRASLAHDPASFQRRVDHGARLRGIPLRAHLYFWGLLMRDTLALTFMLASLLATAVAYTSSVDRSMERAIQAHKR